MHTYDSKLQHILLHTRLHKCRYCANIHVIDKSNTRKLTNFFPQAVWPLPVNSYEKLRNIFPNATGSLAREGLRVLQRALKDSDMDVPTIVAMLCFWGENQDGILNWVDNIWIPSAMHHVGISVLSDSPSRRFFFLSLCSHLGISKFSSQGDIALQTSISTSTFTLMSSPRTTFVQLTINPDDDIYWYFDFDTTSL